MPIKRFSRKNIYGLDDILKAKLDAINVKKTMDEVLSSASELDVPSVKAIQELKNVLEAKIATVKSVAESIIDDTVASSSNKTWSIDKIKEFVASVDDTVVVQDIQQRDALKAYDSLIAFVLDTSADKNLPDDVRGKPFSYIYANGQWQPLAPLAKEIDTTVFVKYSDIVNDVTTGGADKPLSAEMGKYIANELIPQSVDAAKTQLVTEMNTITNGKIKLSKQPIGNLVFDCAEISTDEGIVVVDAKITNPKEVTIDVQNAADYEGKVARVCFLAALNEKVNTDKTKEPKNDSNDDQADGAIATDDNTSKNTNNDKNVNDNSNKAQNTDNKDANDNNTQKADSDKDADSNNSNANNTANS